jgi:dehydratase
MRVHVRATRAVVAACGLGLASAFVAAGPASAAPTGINWDCQANPPIGSSQQLTLNTTIDAQAPAHIGPGTVFDVVLTSSPQTVPGQASGYTVNNLRDLKLRVPVPAGSSFQGVTLSGGSNLGGTPTVTQVGGVVTLSVPGPIAGGSTFQFPTLDLSLTATGASGSTITTRVAGTSYADPGLTFTANVHVSPGIDPNVPTTCFPNPSPALSATTIDNPGAAPGTNLSPALASWGNRTIAVATGTDGRLFYNWWDLGGGGNGWREVPGGGGTDAAPAVALVDNGNYAFVLAKGLDGNVYLNQGTPGGEWVGWQSMGIATNVAPSMSSNGNRTIAVITAANGIYYDWWDLGGGGHGWTQVPDLFTYVSVGAGLVDNGDYVFLLAKNYADDTMWLDQGDPTTGRWVGWLRA